MAYTFKHGDRPLDGYTIQRGIGRGGFGEVYYAISDGGREVAIKYLRDNAEIELRGVTACMNLKSPHLVSIFDVKRNTDGEYFIIMEHVAGPSLRDLMVAEPNGIGVDKATYFLCELARGLGYLHDRGIVHRDMKPANIFYEDGQVKIGDYGLSKFISVSRHSAQTTSVGTVHYMAPEVGSGHYTRGIDIYALGVILYEMLLGRVPFEGSSLGEILMKHLTEQPEVDELPEPFGKVIRKALAKDPKDRYQTVEEMVEEVMSVGDVKQSLAGFNPVTITNVPRVPTPKGMHSPIPSPNPTIALGARHVPPPPPPNMAIDRGELPAAVAKRVSRISDKVERRMDKLAGRPHRGRRAKLAQAVSGQTGAVRSYGIAIAILLAASLGVAFLVGSWSNEETAATAGMMTAFMTTGILVSARMRESIGEHQPHWVSLGGTLLVAGPLMAIATAPLADRYGVDAFALTFGLLAITLFADWDERIGAGSEGMLGWGSAIWLGFLGAVCCALSARGLFDTHRADMFPRIGGVIAAAVSLLVHATSWFLPWPATAGRATSKNQDGSSAKQDENVVDDGDDAANESDAPWPVRQAWNDRQEVRAGRLKDAADIPMGIPVGEAVRPDGWASLMPLPKRRSPVARVLFSLLSFMLVFGSVATVNYAIFSDVSRHRHALFELVAGAIFVFSLLVFCAQKLTVWKRDGFWRETLCPFLLSGSMFLLGVVIAHLVIMQPRHGEFALNVSGIAMFGLLFFVMLAFRMKPARRRSQHPPVVDPAVARAAFVGDPTPQGDSPTA